MSVKKLTLAGIIGAIYAALTMLLAPISFGVIQCRVSEALCILPVFTPVAVWGLFVGCFIANLFTGSLIDIIAGSLTTLLAAFLTYKMRKKPYLAMLPPVILNAVIVGSYLALYIADGTTVIMSILYVGIGQGISCYGLGIPFYHLMKKKAGKLFKS